MIFHIFIKSHKLLILWNNKKCFVTRFLLNRCCCLIFHISIEIHQWFCELTKNIYITIFFAYKSYSVNKQQEEPKIWKLSIFIFTDNECNFNIQNFICTLLAFYQFLNLVILEVDKMWIFPFTIIKQYNIFLKKSPMFFSHKLINFTVPLQIIVMKNPYTHTWENSRMMIKYKSCKLKSLCVCGMCTYWIILPYTRKYTKNTTSMLQMLKSSE